MKQKFFNSFYLMNGISKLRKSTGKEALFNRKSIEEIQATGLDGEAQTSWKRDVIDCQAKKKSSGDHECIFEVGVIKEQTCNPSWPICLYDFTFRLLYPRYQSLTLGENETSRMITNHFSENLLFFEEHFGPVVKAVFRQRGETLIDSRKTNRFSMNLDPKLQGSDESTLSLGEKTAEVSDHHSDISTRLKRKAPIKRCASSTTLSSTTSSTSSGQIAIPGLLAARIKKTY